MAESNVIPPTLENVGYMLALMESVRKEVLEVTGINLVAETDDSKT